jgi:uncharacterized membrane protein YfcA
MDQISNGQASKERWYDVTAAVLLCCAAWLAVPYKGYGAAYQPNHWYDYVPLAISGVIALYTFAATSHRRRRHRDRQRRRRAHRLFGGARVLVLVLAATPTLAAPVTLCCIGTTRRPPRQRLRRQHRAVSSRPARA